MPNRGQQRQDNGFQRDRMRYRAELNHRLSE